MTQCLTTLTRLHITKDSKIFLPRYLFQVSKAQNFLNAAHKTHDCFSLHGA